MNLIPMLNRALFRLDLQLVRTAEIDQLRVEAQYQRERNIELTEKINRKTANVHYWRKQCEALRKVRP